MLKSNTFKILTAGMAVVKLDLKTTVTMNRYHAALKAPSRRPAHT